MFIFAAGGDSPYLNGKGLPLQWVVPFVGILLSIAIFPLVAEHFWHHNFGKISLFLGFAVNNPAIGIPWGFNHGL